VGFSESGLEEQLEAHEKQEVSDHTKSCHIKTYYGRATTATGAMAAAARMNARESLI
jgi:hypothetical protein